MSSARIAVVLPNLAGGGAERLHVHLAREWIQRGHEVEFALMARVGDLLETLPGSVNAVDLQAPRVRQLLLPLVRYLRSRRPDVTLVAMWPLTSIAILAWWLAGRPGRLFVSDHCQLSISSVQEMNVPMWLLANAVRLTYPHATGIIMVSEGVKRDLCAMARLPLDSMKVIYNPTAIGVKPCEAEPALRERLWGAVSGPCILSVGTLKAQKDHKTLIEAFARLPKSLNAKLVILGEGSLRSELEALVRQLRLGDSVLMPGFVLDPYPWYQTADLFVLSSRWEGFGNVIVEALECGVPVVSTDCPSGPAEILRNGEFGSLVPIQDAVAMAEAITRALDHPVDRSALRRRAQDFSVSSIAAEYLDYFGVEGTQLRNDHHA